MVPMDTLEVRVARTIGDLAGLPIGTRIATNDSKLLELYVGPKPGVNSSSWIIPGTLEPFYQALVSWLPAVVLPPVVDPRADLT